MLLAAHQAQNPKKSIRDTTYAIALSSRINERTHPVVTNQEHINIQRAYGNIG
jgi:hypothetical protein